jgi:hypothetical protein
MATSYARVEQDSVSAAGEGTDIQVKASKMGFQITSDFYTQMAIEGRVYQIRAGTIATGVAMDSVTTDAAAEGSVDVTAGTTIIPCDFTMSFDNIATATTVKVGIKAVGVVSSAGTAFVPLPMLQGGTAATSTARVANNGGVTVTAELATTTRRLFIYHDVATQTPTTDTTGGGAGVGLAIASVAWTPKAPYIGMGPACVYIQAASTAAFPLYFFALNYIELPTTGIS